MIELAVGEFHVPLVMVMGHTGCLAVGQLLDGDKGGAGGLHRFTVLSAVYRAKHMQPTDLFREAVIQNIHQAIEHLVRDSYTLRSALKEGKTSIVGALYEMDSGEVRILEPESDLVYKF